MSKSYTTTYCVVLLIALLAPSFVLCTTNQQEIASVNFKTTSFSNATLDQQNSLQMVQKIEKTDNFALRLKNHDNILLPLACDTRFTTINKKSSVAIIEFLLLPPTTRDADAKSSYVKAAHRDDITYKPIYAPHELSAPAITKIGDRPDVYVPYLQLVEKYIGKERAVAQAKDLFEIALFNKFKKTVRVLFECGISPYWNYRTIAITAQERKQKMDALLHVSIAPIHVKTQTLVAIKQ